MIMRVRQATSHRLIAAIVAAAIIGVALLIALVVIPAGGGDNASPADMGGRGGSGGELPKEQLAIFEALPLYEGAVSGGGPESAEGTDVWAIYYVKDTPDKIVAFYERELGAKSWQLDDSRTETVEKAGGGELTVYSDTFVKDDMKVTVTTDENTKVPEKGDTRLQVAVTPR